LGGECAPLLPPFHHQGWAARLWWVGVGLVGVGGGSAGSGGWGCWVGGLGAGGAVWGGLGAPPPHPPPPPPPPPRQAGSHAPELWAERGPPRGPSGGVWLGLREIGRCPIIGMAGGSHFLSRHAYRSVSFRTLAERILEDERTKADTRFSATSSRPTTAEDEKAGELVVGSALGDIDQISPTLSVNRNSASAGTMAGGRIGGGSRPSAGYAARQSPRSRRVRRALRLPTFPPIWRVAPEFIWSRNANHRAVAACRPRAPRLLPSFAVSLHGCRHSTRTANRDFAGP